MDPLPSAIPGLPHLETMDQMSSAPAGVASPGLVYYILCTIYLVVVTIVGLGLNTLFLVAYLKQSRLRTPIGTLYLNLCIADLFISVSSLVKAVYMGTGAHMEEGKFMCDIFGFATFIGGIQSLFSLAAIALYRYIVVTRRMNSQPVTLRQMLTTLLTLWTVGIGLASGPLFGWNQYVPSQPDTWCSLKFSDRSTTGISYLAVVFSLVFLLPVGIITFSYTSIWFTLKQLSNLLGESRGRQTVKAHKAVARSSFLVAACFLVAWLPYAILSVCIFIRIAPPTLPYYIAVIPAMMCKASPCLNPIVYFKTDPEIRKYLRVWYECLNPKPMSDDSEEQKIELETHSMGNTGTPNKSSSSGRSSGKQSRHNGALEPCKLAILTSKCSLIAASNNNAPSEADEQLELGNQCTDFITRI